MESNEKNINKYNMKYMSECFNDWNLEKVGMIHIYGTRQGNKENIEKYNN